MSRFRNLKAKSNASPQDRAETTDHTAVDLQQHASAAAPSRIGKKQIYGWFSQELKTQFNIIRAKEGKKEQALLGEALDLLFHSRGLHPLGER